MPGNAPTKKPAQLSLASFSKTKTFLVEGFAPQCSRQINRGMNLAGTSMESWCPCRRISMLPLRLVLLLSVPWLLLHLRKESA